MNNLIKVEVDDDFLVKYQDDIKSVGEIKSAADLANARSVIKIKKELKNSINEKHKDAKKQLKKMTGEIKTEVERIIGLIDASFEPAQKRLNFYNMKERERKAEKQAAKDKEVAEKMQALEERKRALEAENAALKNKEAMPIYLDEADFVERELKNNEVIKRGVEAWSERINAKVIGDIKEDHIAVKTGNIDSDDTFKADLKAGRVVVEDALNRWNRTQSASACVAKSMAKHKFKIMECKRFLLLQIELEEENKGWS